MNSINNMPSDSRLWVYQSTRELTDAEVKAIQAEAEVFLRDWHAHGAALRSAFEILYNRFVVIAVDEKQAMASGCSIDKSVHFVKDLEQKFGLNFFDRMQVAYKQGNKILACSLNELEKKADLKEVNAETVVFNNMVSSKMAFDTEWEVPLRKSWQSRVLK
jgi:hypothetical protein